MGRHPLHRLDVLALEMIHQLRERKTFPILLDGGRIAQAEVACSTSEGIDVAHGSHFLIVGQALVE